MISSFLKLLQSAEIIPVREFVNNLWGQGTEYIWVVVLVPWNRFLGSLKLQKFRLWISTFRVYLWQTSILRGREEEGGRNVREVS
jgi:hypothetical protein